MAEQQKLHGVNQVSAEIPVPGVARPSLPASQDSQTFRSPNFSGLSTAIENLNKGKADKELGSFIAATRDELRALHNGTDRKILAEKKFTEGLRKFGGKQDKRLRAGILDNTEISVERRDGELVFVDFDGQVVGRPEEQESHEELLQKDMIDVTSTAAANFPIVAQSFNSLGLVLNRIEEKTPSGAPSNVRQGFVEFATRNAAVLNNLTQVLKDETQNIGRIRNRGISTRNKSLEGFKKGGISNVIRAVTSIFEGVVGLEPIVRQALMTEKGGLQVGQIEVLLKGLKQDVMNELGDMKFFQNFDIDPGAFDRDVLEHLLKANLEMANNFFKEPSAIVERSKNIAEGIAAISKANEYNAMSPSNKRILVQKDVFVALAAAAAATEKLSMVTRKGTGLPRTLADLVGQGLTELLSGRGYAIQNNLSKFKQRLKKATNNEIKFNEFTSGIDQMLSSMDSPFSVLMLGQYEAVFKAEKENMLRAAKGLDGGGGFNVQQKEKKDGPKTIAIHNAYRFLDQLFINYNKALEDSALDAVEIQDINRRMVELRAAMNELRTK